MRLLLAGDALFRIHKYMEHLARKDCHMLAKARSSTTAAGSLLAAMASLHQP